MALFGQRLFVARKKRGFTMRDLASKSGVDIGWISKLEAGKRDNISFQATIRLADALMVTTDSLAGRKLEGATVIKEEF